MSRKCAEIGYWTGPIERIRVLWSSWSEKAIGTKRNVTQVKRSTVASCEPGFERHNQMRMIILRSFAMSLDSKLRHHSYIVQVDNEIRYECSERRVDVHAQSGKSHVSSDWVFLTNAGMKNFCEYTCWALPTHKSVKAVELIREVDVKQSLINKCYLIDTINWLDYLNLPSKTCPVMTRKL